MGKHKDSNGNTKLDYEKYFIPFDRLYQVNDGQRFSKDHTVYEGDLTPYKDIHYSNTVGGAKHSKDKNNDGMDF